MRSQLATKITRNLSGRQSFNVM